MKRYLNKKFTGVFLGALGTIVSTVVVVLMITGDLQKIVHFAGATEEMVFTFFDIVIGILSLIGSISCAIEIDRE
jgi:hypothetical protein